MRLDQITTLHFVITNNMIIMLSISSKQYAVCLENSSEFRLRNEDYVKQMPPFKSSRPILHISNILHLWSSWPCLEKQKREAPWKCEVQRWQQICKCWKQPKCPSVNEWIKNCATFTQWNATQQKERRTPTLCNSMDGTGEHYAK